MIIGRVNENLEAVISLSVVKTNNDIREIEAVVDTGYSGYFSLSFELISELNLSRIGQAQLTLADGTIINSNVYEATILWEGQPRIIQVDAFESSILVGMSLLKNCDFNMRVAVNSPVSIIPFYDSTNIPR
jgi:clan AA aspartic protease